MHAEYLKQLNEAKEAQWLLLFEIEKQAHSYSSTETPEELRHRLDTIEKLVVEARNQLRLSINDSYDEVK